jgi:PAS domain S-box-containing protein
MSISSYSLLIVNEKVSECEHLQNLLANTKRCKFELEKVSNFEEASVVTAYQNYDAYIVSDRLAEYPIWTKKVAPNPVILLTKDDGTGIKALKNGLADYILYDELNTSLLEHSLYLSFLNRDLKINLQPCKSDDQTEIKNFSEQLFQTIFDNCTEGMVVVDYQGIIRFINPMGISLLNKPLSQLINNEFGIPLEDKKSTQMEVVNPEGEITFLEMTIAATKWNENLAWLVVIRDITENLRRQEALHRSEKSYQEFYEQTPAMLQSMDMDGKIICVSDLWLETFGYRRDEVIGKKVTNFVTEESRKYAQTFIKPEFFKKDLIKDTSCQFVKKNGEIIDILLSARAAEKDQKGNIRNYIAILGDITAKKRAEAELYQYRCHLEQLVAKKSRELYESEKMFRELAENIMSVFWLANLQTEEMLYVSPAYEKIWGYSCESIYRNPLSWLNSVHPEDKEAVIANFRQQRKQPHTYIEHRIIDKSQNLRWISTSTFLIFNRQGKPEKIAAISQDITEKEQAKIALQESEKRYFTLTKAIPVGVFRHDAEGNCIYINDKFIEIIGLSRKECLFSNWTNQIHPEDREKVMQKWSDCLEKKSFFQAEYRVLKLNGEITWVYAQAIFEINQTGEVISSIGTLTDISDRKKTEIALRESEKRYATLAKVIPVGLYLCDRHQDCIYINDKCSEFIGIPPDKCIKKEWINCIHPEDREYVWQRWLDFLAGKCPFQLEYRFLHSDGKIIWVYAQTILETDENGEIIGSLGTLTDITERKKTEIVLQESKKSLQLAQKIAHLGNWDWQLQKDQLFWSDEVYRIFELQPEQFQPSYENFLNCIHPDDRDFINQTIEDIISTGNTYNIHYRIILPNKKVRIINEQGDLVLNQEGNPLRIIGTLQDVTERIIAESKLKYHLQVETTLVKISRELASNNNLNISDILANLGIIFQASCIYINKFNDIDGEINTLYQWCDPNIKHNFPSEQNINPNSFSWWRNQLLEDKNIIIYDLSDFPAEAESEKEYFNLKGVDSLISIPIYIKDNKLWGSITIEQYKKIEKTWFLAITEINIQNLRIVGEIIYANLARQKTEKELRESEIRYRAIVEDQTELICRFLPDGTIKFMNNAYCKYFNLSTEYMMGNKSNIFLNPNHKQLNSIEEKYCEIFNPLNPIQTREKHFTFAGEDRWLQWTQRAIFDQLGKIVEFQAIGMDITERKKAEKALKESEENFRGIFENAPVGISIIKPSGHFLKVNKKYCDFLKYPELELLKLTIKKITYTDDLPKTIQSMKDLLSGQIQNCSFEKRYLTKSGKEKWGHITCTLVRDAAENPRYLIAIIEDIQERKENQIALEKAKQQAEAANIAKSQFLANMSHELRTPLNAILGFTQLMSKSSQLTPQNQEYLQIINRAGEHLLSLINDILDLSKIEAGKIDLNIETFDLYDLLDSIQEIFTIKAAGKQLEIIFNKHSQVPQYIQTDKSKLRSTLINLLSNAIKFTKKGHINLRVKPVENKNKKINLVFMVKDTGVGISNEEQSKLFDVFAQTQSGQRSGEGSGLGLAITKNFVELMGGKIDVTSKVGVGSTFTFNILCELGEQNNIPSPENKGHIIGLQPNQPLYRILIVEDHSSNRRLLNNLLRSIGFQVQEATNGREAIDLWQTWQPHLILMDLRIPVMDGYETIKQIRLREDQTKSPVKIIVISASILESQKQKLMDLGCEDFISKPLQENELWQTIAAHLGVSYLYESLSNSDSLTNFIEYNQLQGKDFLIMSSQWRQQLYQACLAARKRKILQLIKQIPSQNTIIINSLTQMVEQLNFEGIINLIKSCDGQ